MTGSDIAGHIMRSKKIHEIWNNTEIPINITHHMTVAFCWFLFPLRSVLGRVEPYHLSSTTDVAAIITCPTYKAEVGMQSVKAPMILSLPHYLFVRDSDLLMYRWRDTEKRRQFLLHRAIDMQLIKSAPRKCWMLMIWYFISPLWQMLLMLGPLQGVQSRKLFR